MPNTSPNKKHQEWDDAHFSAVGFPEEQCGSTQQKGSLHPETWAPLLPVPFISSVKFTYSSIFSSAQMGTTQKVVTRINKGIHI